jgi:mannosylglycerate hydrolase
VSKTRRLCLYLHTHWDREWYLAFEEYRIQLTIIVDEILKELESGSLPSFMLDGQSCVLEDLQEVDRSLTDRIAKLMAAGKIEAGPWYVLADQLLVSGESLMRNLEMGLAVTRQFGQPSMIGYCPDTFGHTQDLPRILQSYGITSAIVWRGVPDLSGKSLFWWLSPDGSKVLTYHLSKGYYQTAFFENRTAENLAEHLLSWRTTSKPGSNQTFDAVLVPVGGDHLSTPVDFMKQLQSARLLTKMESLALAADVGGESGGKENLDVDPLMHPDLQLTSNVVAFQSPGEDNCLIEANSLRRFVELMLRHAGGRGAKIPSFTGELRDNESALQFERAYMLQGVLSTRLYLKRENRLSERRLARVLEPAFAFLHCEKLVEYPAAQLNYAWRLLLQNQPHDSICGCSIDEVHREMMHRTGKFHQVLNVLERRATESLYGTEAGPFLAALKNPLLVDANCLDKKLVIFNLSATESDAPTMMEWCTAVSSGADIDVAAESLPQLDGTDLQIQLVDRSLQTYIFTGTNQFPETKKVLVNRAWVAPKTAVPAFGYRGYSFKPNSAAASVPTSSPSSSLSSSSSSTSTSSPSQSNKNASEQSAISNDLLTVTIDADGMVKVTANGAAGEQHEFVLNHRIKDVGDAGDTYNFDPVEDDGSLQARFIEAKILSRGPLVSSILLKYELGLPAGLEFSSALNLAVENGAASTDYVIKKSRSTVHISHVFYTEIELRKSVPIVFFETKWENLSRDHRLEVFIETGKPVTKVFSENHFSMVERDCPAKQVTLPVEKGTEAPLDRYPCQRFFIANDQAFFNLGLPEFGVDGDAVSLTILRAISALSRPDLRSRGGGAGPSVETPEANCLGPNKVNYGWAPLKVDFTKTSAPQTVRAYQLAEQFENLSWITFGAMTAPAKSFLQLSNESVRMVATRILESNDFIELRLLNVTGETQFTELAISFDHCEALLTTADGRVVEVLNALNEAGDNDADQNSISCAPEMDAFVPHAIYKIKLGANSLVTIRLRLKSRQPAAQPRSGN